MKIIQITALNGFIYGLDEKGQLYEWHRGQNAEPKVGTFPGQEKIPKGWLLLEDERNPSP